MPCLCTVKTDLFDERAVDSRRSNLAPEFIADLSAWLQLDFVPDGCGDLRKTYGPGDVFRYIYAVFHSPTYCSRYAEFLKIDFPRLPLTLALFRSLYALGKELVALHLMEQLSKLETRYPEAGDSMMNAGALYRTGKRRTGMRLDQSEAILRQRAAGNMELPDRWLSGLLELAERPQGAALSYDDLTHYRCIVAALARTIELQTTIDAAIGEWPLQ